MTPYVEASSESEIELVVPNERDAPMTGFVVVVPDDLRIVEARSSDSWSASAEGTTATWSGGTLRAGAEAAFTLEVEARSEPGPASLRTEQRYPDGRVARWYVPLTVTPAADAPTQSLGWAVIAALVGLVALTAFGAFVWRRRSAAA